MNEIIELITGIQHMVNAYVDLSVVEQSLHLSTYLGVPTSLPIEASDMVHAFTTDNGVQVKILSKPF